MLDKTEYSRLVIKRTDETGSVPTIPPITADTLNQFTPTDIMVGEFFLNSVDELLWIRTENQIISVPLGVISGTTGNFEIVSGQTWTELHSLTGGTDVYIDWNNSNVQQLTLTASTNVYFVNGKPGGNYKLIVKQASSGGYSVVWNITDIGWANGSPPLMSTGSSVYDVYEFVYNGNTYFGSFNQNYGAVAAPSIITTGLYTYFDGTNPLSISGSDATEWVSISGSSSSTATLYNSAYIGELGGGVYFDGVAGFAETDTDILPNSGFTYEVWFEQLSATTEAYTSIYNSETGTFEFWVNPANQVGFYTPGTGNVNIGIVHNLNQPYLYSITYNNSLGVFKVYKNGVEIFNDPSITSFTPDGAFSYFGTDNPQDAFFPGIMYKIRTYSTELSASDVLNNWNVEKGNYGY
jgi:hypothetical protein